MLLEFLAITNITKRQIITDQQVAHI